jgi:hypothetical protein
MGQRQTSKPGTEDLEMNDAEDAGQAAKKSKIQKDKKKRKPEPEPEESEPGEPEQPEQPKEDAEGEKSTKKGNHKNKKARITSAVAKDAGGTDSILKSGITLTQAKRLLTWCPSILNKGSYGQSEGLARLDLSQEHVTTSAAREVQVRAEAVLRKLAEKAVMRAVESGKDKVDAITVYQILREYEDRLSFTGAAPPRGLLRHAQAMEAISMNNDDLDDDQIMKEQETSRLLHNKYKTFKKEAEEAKKKRAASRAERAKAVAA